MVIKSVGVLSLGKMLGAMYGAIGLVFGVIASIGTLFGGLSGTLDQPGGVEGAVSNILFGAGAFVILPVFYGLIGFVSGVITAFVFNVAASVAGGLRIEIDQAP